MFKEKYGYLLEGEKLSDKEIRKVVRDNFKKLYKSMEEKGVKSPEARLVENTVIGHSTIWRYAYGEMNIIPSLDALVQIAYVCNLKLSDLFKQNISFQSNKFQLKDFNRNEITTSDIIDNFIDDFDERYWELKNSSGMSDSAICKLSGIHRNRLSEFKNNEVTVVTLRDFLRVCMTFDNCIDDYFGWFLEGGDLDE